MKPPRMTVKAGSRCSKREKVANSIVFNQNLRRKVKDLIVLMYVRDILFCMVYRDGSDLYCCSSEACTSVLSQEIPSKT